LAAAIDLELGGRGVVQDVLKNHPDPVVGGSFEYQEFQGWFELRSKWKLASRPLYRDEGPVALTVGRRAKQVNPRGPGGRSVSKPPGQSRGIAASVSLRYSLSQCRMPLGRPADGSTLHRLARREKVQTGRPDVRDAIGRPPVPTHHHSNEAEPG